MLKKSDIISGERFLASSIAPEENLTWNNTSSVKDSAQKVVEINLSSHRSELKTNRVEHGGFGRIDTQRKSEKRPANRIGRGRARPGIPF